MAIHQPSALQKSPTDLKQNGRWRGNGIATSGCAACFASDERKRTFSSLILHCFSLKQGWYCHEDTATNVDLGMHSISPQSSSSSCIREFIQLEFLEECTHRGGKEQCRYIVYKMLQHEENHQIFGSNPWSKAFFPDRECKLPGRFSDDPKAFIAFMHGEFLQGRG